MKKARAASAIKARLMGLAAGVMLLPAGCGVGTARPHGRASNFRDSAETQGSRVTEASALGASVPFTGGDDPGAQRQSWELVSVVRVLRWGSLTTRSSGRLASAAGYNYVVVELNIHDLGKPIYRGNPGRETSLISANSGGYIGRRIRPVETDGPCTNDLLRPIALHLGQTARGCVFFRVPLAQPVSAVQYETDGGREQNTATWALDRFKVHG